MSGQPKIRDYAQIIQKPPRVSVTGRQGWLRDLDAVVVGGGLVGMSAALRLRQRHPDWRMLISRPGHRGGRDHEKCGLACFGSPSELLEDWQQLGAEATVALVKMRWDGLQALRQTWGDHALGYRDCGAVEAFSDPAPRPPRCTPKTQRSPSRRWAPNRSPPM